MKRMMNGISILGLFAAMFTVLLTTPRAAAQSTTDGAIGGTLTDQSGAVVTAAQVKATNGHQQRVNR